MTTSTPAVSVRGVSKSFGGVQAVRDVSLDVADGERRAIIGTNGAGKTTLFNLIAGDLTVSAGTIRLFGHDVTAMPLHRRTRLGLRRTYQTSALFDGLTVAQNVYLAFLGEQPVWQHLNFFIRAPLNGAMQDRIEAVLDQVGLAHRARDPVAELSHGERRQLEIGLAVATRPRILLLDEPAAGLSLQERTQMVELLKTLDRSMTILLIEHDMNIALGLADAVTVMHEGKVIAQGTPEAIRKDERVQRIYLGGAVGG